MTISDEQRIELITTIKPLMEWMNKNCHPHTIAIIGCEVAQLTEGSIAIRREEWYGKDRP